MTIPVPQATSSTRVRRSHREPGGQVVGVGDEEERPEVPVVVERDRPDERRVLLGHAVRLSRRGGSGQPAETPGPRRRPPVSYCFTAPKVSPVTMWRWTISASTRTGSVIIVAAAASVPQLISS